jgi:flagellin-like hook-associated protein FlgL
MIKGAYAASYSTNLGCSLIIDTSGSKPWAKLWYKYDPSTKKPSVYVEHYNGSGWYSSSTWGIEFDTVYVFEHLYQSGGTSAPSNFLCTYLRSNVWKSMSRGDTSSANLVGGKDTTCSSVAINPGALTLRPFNHNYSSTSPGEGVLVKVFPPLRKTANTAEKIFPDQPSNGWYLMSWSSGLAPEDSDYALEYSLSEIKNSPFDMIDILWEDLIAKDSEITSLSGQVTDLATQLTDTETSVKGTSDKDLTQVFLEFASTITAVKGTAGPTLLTVKDSWLNDPTHGLPKLKDLLADGTFGLSALQSLLAGLGTGLSDVYTALIDGTTGLGNIKARIDTVEDKVNNLADSLATTESNIRGDIVSLDSSIATGFTNLGTAITTDGNLTRTDISDLYTNINADLEAQGLTLGEVVTAISNVFLQLVPAGGPSTLDMLTNIYEFLILLQSDKILDFFNAMIGNIGWSFSVNDHWGTAEFLVDYIDAIIDGEFTVELPFSSTQFEYDGSPEQLAAIKDLISAINPPKHFIITIFGHQFGFYLFPYLWWLPIPDFIHDWVLDETESWTFGEPGKTKATIGELLFDGILIIGVVALLAITIYVAPAAAARVAQLCISLFASWWSNRKFRHMTSLMNYVVGFITALMEYAINPTSTEYSSPSDLDVDKLYDGDYNP